MTTAATPAIPRAQYLKELGLISVGHGLTHWYPATFYLLLPLIGKELGLSFTQIGLILTVQHVVGAIANLPGGMVVDAYGKKGHLLVMSLIWIGVPYAVMSMAHSYWVLLLCMALVGIGNNLWHPAAIPTLAFRYPLRKGFVLSVHGMFGNLGEAIAPLVIGALLTWFSWRTVVVMNVVPGVFMAALILILLGAFAVAKEGDAHAINAKAAEPWSARKYFADFLSLFRNKSLMLVSVSSMVRTFTQAGLLTFLPLYLAYELKYNPFMVGVCMAVMQIAAFAASPVAGHLSDKWGRRRVVMSSMWLTGVTIVGMVLTGGTIWFVVFVGLVGSFLYAMRSVFQAWAVESTPKHLAGTGVGVQFSITAIGGGIAPLFFGVIADAWGLYVTFYAMAVTIVLGNFLVMFVPGGEKK
ncbi:MAG: MFS transporter [Betaproteobacteria bacterium]|nr:MFS transporter [Betaproteobacteria bacterium]